MSAATRAPRASAQPHRLRATLGNAWESWGLPVAMLLTILLVWWLIADTMQERARIFASPAAVVEELRLLFLGETPLGNAYGHLAATLYRLVAAFVISLSLGGLLGVVAGRIKDVFDLLDNITWIFMAVPSVVWVFIFAVAVGRSNAVPIGALSALMTPLVLLNVAEGAKAVPKDLVEMSDAFGVGTRQRIQDVFLPHLVPYFLGAARVSFALGLKLVIVAEVVALSRGVGYLVVYWRDSVQMAPIVAWGVVLIAVGLIVDYGVFVQLERRFTKWRAPVETRRRAPE